MSLETKLSRACAPPRKTEKTSRRWARWSGTVLRRLLGFRVEGIETERSRGSFKRTIGLHAIIKGFPFKGTGGFHSRFRVYRGPRSIPGKAFEAMSSLKTGVYLEGRGT